MSKIINTNINLEQAVEAAAGAYSSGGVFVYPTDTIYGFGGDPFNSHAVETINKIKGRDESKRFIQLVDSIDTLSEYVQLENNRYRQLLENIWPNPVSVILPLKEIYAGRLGTGTVAYRIPNERFCTALLSHLRAPIISTSVNRSGSNALNDAGLIAAEFGDSIDLLCSSDSEGEKVQSAPAVASTIIDLTGNDGPVLIREGSISFSAIMGFYR